jgi:hypothetical protein
MEHDKYLIVKGVAGLGDRFATLANAIEYARKSGRILLVDWSDGVFGTKGDNVFYRYFRLSDIPYATSIDTIFEGSGLTCYPDLWAKQPYASMYDLYKRESRFRRVPRLMKGKGLFSKFFHYLYPKEQTMPKFGLNAVFNKHNIPFGGFYQQNMSYDVLFFVDFYPKFKHKIIRKNLALADDLEREIDNMAKSYGLATNFVGVHVRMTDKHPQNSLEELSAKINKLNLPDLKIFLATDNVEVEDYFAATYNKSVVFTPKWRPQYDDKKQKTGIHHYAIWSGDYSKAETVLKESIVDMWLLSKCDYLICQKNSGFSQISAILKNQPDKTFSW